MKDRLWILYPAGFLGLVVLVYVMMITLSVQSGETVVDSYTETVAR